LLREYEELGQAHVKGLKVTRPRVSLDVEGDRQDSKINPDFPHGQLRISEC
jgi:hypothetical protein